MSVRASFPTVAALTVATLPLSLVPSLAPAASASPYVTTAVATVNQGDLIYNDATDQECAVGWLSDGYAFTAGQCGADGDLFRDIDNNYLGTFHTDYDAETQRNDFGWIKLDMEVGEGDNVFELVDVDAVERWSWLFWEGPREESTWSRYYGFDGATLIGDGDIADASPVLGEPVAGFDLGLAGIYTGEKDGYTLVTRPDRQASSPHPVDPAYVGTRRGDAQHADVRVFLPDSGLGEVIELPEPAAVDQGMKMVNETARTKCTIGYIGDGVVYSAGHCGEEGDDIWLSNDDDHLVERIGTYHTHYEEDESQPEDYRIKLRNDHGYITLDTPWVRLGSNGYSGDSVVPYEDVRPGLEVCAYGQTTKPEIRCGRVAGIDGADIVMTEGVAGQKGDSGGPVWAKDGSGLVGIFSGGPKDDSAATASYPYAITDNTNKVDLDIDAVLRTFARSLPYYSVFAVYRTFLGVRGDEIPTPAQPIVQGDALYDWQGKPVCRVGYVKGDRLYFASDCGQQYLYTAQGVEVVVVPGSTYTHYRAETQTLADGRWGEVKNLAVADRIVPWDELAPGDEICTSSATAPEERACTTLLGLDGPRLILEDTFEGDFAIPGGPLWVPGKGFAGVYTQTGDEWGRGMRIDMVLADGVGGSKYAAEAVRAWELGETFYQKTPTVYVNDALEETVPVQFPERTFEAGEKLYDSQGEAVCEIARVENDRLVVSSSCDPYVYTRLGDYIGALENPSGSGEQLATIEVEDDRMSAGEDTAEAVVPWEELSPGDQVCAGDTCAAFAGYDGSKLVLTNPLDGTLPGAALRVEDRGMVGIYHQDGIGSRPDMIDDAPNESHTAEIRAAHGEGERFYAHNDAYFWSLTSGKGGLVPFAFRQLDEGSVLYDASGNPTCQIGRTDEQRLYVSSECSTGDVFTAAGELVGRIASAPEAADRGTVATIEVTGHRMKGGTNEHTALADWDALAPGDRLCSSEGCGTFFGLDGAQVVHDAPLPALPGAALWNPEQGFVGVSGGAGKQASRIDMVTEGHDGSFASRVRQASEWGVPYYQRAGARFWSPAGLGAPVPFDAHPRVTQGDQLYDAHHNPICTVGFIDNDVLFTSADCAADAAAVYTEFGEELGSLTVPAPTDARPRFAYVQLDTPYVESGSNAKSGDRIVAWDAAEPGDKVCAYGPKTGERCGTYYGQDGAAVVLSGDVDGDVLDHGGPVWIPGKGLLAVDTGQRDGAHTGARIDMITHGAETTDYTAVTDAFDRGEPFYQRADTHFFSVAQPKGALVPFPKKPVPTPTPTPAPTSERPSALTADPTSDLTEEPTTDREPSSSPQISEDALRPESPESSPQRTPDSAEPTAAPSTTAHTQPTTPPTFSPSARPSETPLVAEDPEDSKGSGGGSSTGGIIAAILIPLLLLGIGFLITQVVDVTQFGLPPVPQILPI